MDATHAVRDGVRYPAVLLTTGMTDPRVEPWQVAKMAARLQAARRAAARGSQPGAAARRLRRRARPRLDARSRRDAERADEYAFVLWRSGMPGFQPKSANG